MIAHYLQLFDMKYDLFAKKEKKKSIKLKLNTFKNLNWPKTIFRFNLQK